MGLFAVDEYRSASESASLSVEHDPTCRPAGSSWMVHGSSRWAADPVTRRSTWHANFGLDVTGLDLDPAMIEVARDNAEGAAGHNRRQPSFVLGDVAALPFLDATCDLVVSTLSMDHWADPRAGLAEIGRVLPSRQPGAGVGSAARPRPSPPRCARPARTYARRSPRVVGAMPWRWPWIFKFTQRIELVRPEGSDEGP
jgi:SAM-dependent methyltransferase